MSFFLSVKLQLDPTKPWAPTIVHVSAIGASNLAMASSLVHQVSTT